jgi:hypothetical protein
MNSLYIAASEPFCRLGVCQFPLSRNSLLAKLAGHAREPALSDRAYRARCERLYPRIKCINTHPKHADLPALSKAPKEVEVGGALGLGRTFVSTISVTGLLLGFLSWSLLFAHNNVCASPFTSTSNYESMRGLRADIPCWINAAYCCCA